jgi:PHS family inorganic phosphate transporter-like MFS transporter
MYGSELILIISMTVVQCFAGDINSGMNICQMLMLWRFFLGIGIGGDYPLSAIITSEFANTRNRGALMGAVFSMQGFGYLTGSLVAIIILCCLKSGIEGPDSL